MIPTSNYGVDCNLELLLRADIYPINAKIILFKEALIKVKVS